MLILFVFGCFYFSASAISRNYAVLSEGAFNYPLVNDENVEYNNGVSTMYLAISQRCIDSFSFSGAFPVGSTISVDKVSGVSPSGEYTWTTVGSAATESPATSVAFSSPVCASQWRFQVAASSDVSPWTGVSFLGSEAKVKRAVTCEIVGQYDAECSAASEGALCLEGGLCGCKVDNDCFGNTDFPYCIVDKGYCDKCHLKNDSVNADHFFCQTRYPGYAANPTTNEALPTERVAPVNFYRTVCFRPSITPETGSGSCQRCNQAPFVDFGFNHASNQGASGTVFCQQLNPNMPICIDKVYFDDTNSAAFYNVSLRGSCGPCMSSALCARALPKTPVCNLVDGSCGTCKENVDCVGTGGNNCQADGSCFTCRSNADCGSKDGGSDAGAEVCQLSTGTCGPCETNAECIGTSGSNCQKNGQCITCKSDNDCLNVDGGEISNQTLCNPATGICFSACQTNQDCVGLPGANCQKSGRCVTCQSDADCGDKDGGSVSDEPKCDATTGICYVPFNCSNNYNCSTEFHGTLPNCQKDGICVFCTEETCQFDGGEQTDQPNCNVVTGVCQSKCTTDFDCVNTTGKNCKSDGYCKNCQSNAECVSLFPSEPARSTCDLTTGVCGKCYSNSECTEQGRVNCGTDGSCFNCSVEPTGCANDLGGQPHCDHEYGICLDASKCTEDAHCAATPCTPKCRTDTYCCVQCTQHSDCPHDGWKNDAKNKTTCSATTNTCVHGCTSDSDCPASAKACIVHTGQCVQCQSDFNCGGSEPACNTNSGNCVICTNDRHCAQFGLAACSISEQRCVQCTSDFHCEKEDLNKRCDTAGQKCIECSVDSHCEGNKEGKNRCDSGAQQCVECLSDHHCAAPKHCDTANQKCVGCLMDSQCGDNSHCDTASMKCVDGIRTILSTGAIIGIAVAAAVIFAMLIAIIVLSVAMRKRISYETQPLMA